jgi:O-antigen/teichoic acid export membrane protein
MFRTVFKNTSYLLFNQLVNKALFIVLVVFIARVLGQEALGEYAFVFVFETFLYMGLNAISSDLTIREASGDRALLPRLMGARIVLNMAVMLIFLAALIIFSAAAIGGSLPVLSLQLIWFDAFILSFLEVFACAFRSYEKMKYEAVTMMIHDVTAVGGSIAFIAGGYGIPAVILSFIAGKAFAFAYASAVMFFRFPRPSYDFDRGFFKGLIVASVPFIVNGISILIMFRIDILMLGLMRGQGEVGLYESAYMLIKNIDAVVFVFIASLFPVLSRLHGADDARLRQMFRKSFMYLAGVGLSAAVGVSLLARPIILALYGEGFSDAVSLLPLLMAGWFFLILSTLNTYMLNAMRMERRNLVFVMSGAAFNVLLNLALIPAYGYFGAAWATAATYLALFCVQTLFMRFACGIRLWRAEATP